MRRCFLLKAPASFPQAFINFLHCWNIKAPFHERFKPNTESEHNSAHFDGCSVASPRVTTADCTAGWVVSVTHPAGCAMVGLSSLTVQSLGGGQRAGSGSGDLLRWWTGVSARSCGDGISSVAVVATHLRSHSSEPGAGLKVSVDFLKKNAFFLFQPPKKRKRQIKILCEQDKMGSLQAKVVCDWNSWEAARMRVSLNHATFVHYDALKSITCILTLLKLIDHLISQP